MAEDDDFFILSSDEDEAPGEAMDTSPSVIADSDDETTHQNFRRSKAARELSTPEPYPESDEKNSVANALDTTFDEELMPTSPSNDRDVTALEATMNVTTIDDVIDLSDDEESFIGRPTRRNRVLLSDDSMAASPVAPLTKNRLLANKEENDIPGIIVEKVIKKERQRLPSIEVLEDNGAPAPPIIDLTDNFGENAEDEAEIEDEAENEDEESYDQRHQEDSYLIFDDDGGNLTVSERDGHLSFETSALSESLPPPARPVQQAAPKESSDALVRKLHKELDGAPKGELAETPKGFKMDLLTHQREALAWMAYRERPESAAKGGILADDMGLGKTATTLALIVSARAEKKRELREPPRNCRYSAGTLLIVPLAVFKQWQDEVRKFAGNRMSVYAHHGSSRETSASAIARHDIVITTYQTLDSEHKKASTYWDSNWGDISKTPLGRIVWRRVVLDEAHHIKNPLTGAAKACCALLADSRWALTGTPIQNCTKDFYSLVKFVRVFDLGEQDVWKDLFESSSKNCAARLRALTSTIVLHRKKEETEVAQVLPTKKVVEVKLELSEEETEVYIKMFDAAKKLFEAYMKNKANVARFGRDVVGGSNVQMSHILAMLLRLRQACVHFALVREAIDMDALAEMNVENVNLDNSLHSVVDDEFRAVSKGRQQLFKKDYRSPKLARCIELVSEAVFGKSEKIIVVSQWTSFLAIVEEHLNEMELPYLSYTGKLSHEERGVVLKKFNDEKEYRVLLLSLTAGGCGLNLIAANNMVIMDCPWNPALEKQCYDRIHRIGQKKPVTIHRLMISDSIEDRVNQLQQKKLEHAENVLAGTAKAAATFSLRDIQALFDMDTHGGARATTQGKQKPPRNAQQRFAPPPNMPLFPLNGPRGY